MVHTKTIFIRKTDTLQNIPDSTCLAGLGLPRREVALLALASLATPARPSLAAGLNLAGLLLLVAGGKMSKDDPGSDWLLANVTFGQLLSAGGLRSMLLSAEIAFSRGGFRQTCLSVKTASESPWLKAVLAERLLTDSRIGQKLPWLDTVLAERRGPDPIPAKQAYHGHPSNPSKRQGQYYVRLATFF